MRKLYTLVTGLFLSLVAMKAIGQDNVVSCTADFEITTATNATLTKKFTAIPWHSNQKRPVYICWSFGDGSDTCIQFTNTYPGPYSVVHTYRHAGTYEVCVKIVYDGGCEAKKCKTITAEEFCKVDFEKAPVSTTINPLYVSFYAYPWHSASKRPQLICWNFGDGQDTCIQYGEDYTGLYTIKHKYNEPGVYQVCIKVKYFGGCEAYICKQVVTTRPDQCSADFQKVPLENTDNPLVIGLKALPWHNNNKKPKLICWSFGDGQDTCVEYMQDYTGPYGIRHKYNQPGTYEVCVKILYDGGCEAKSCKKIEVIRPDECKADFERIQITNTLHPFLVYYRAIPWHNNNKKPKLICWKFGDGKDTCIEYPENYAGGYALSHEYREPGNYQVCIRIVYYGGCEAGNCRSIQVGRTDECKIDFERVPVTSTDHPRIAVFKATPSHNNNKKPKLICWNFGDGKDTCIEYPENYTGTYTVKHEFHDPGVYQVCVKVIYYGGCDARLCKEIRIGEPECKADFERIPSTSNDVLQVNFKALPANSNNRPPAVICWKFGDGRDTCIQYPENYSGPYIVKHQYLNGGEYEVCIEIKYYGGCEARLCKKIILQVPPDECRVKLFEITPSISSLVRGFYAAPSHSNGKRPVTVCWSFGDGQDTCFEINSFYPLPNLFIRHTYPGPGVYRACVKVLFRGGCTAFDCKEVVIRPVSNVCGGFITDSLVSPRTFKFRAFPIHNPDDPVASITWSFGDGSSSSGREVSHTYNSPGTYELCVVIKTQRGCETRICKKLNVPGNTHSALQLTPNPVINNLYVLFYSTHTEPVNIKVLNANGVVLRDYMRNAVAGANNWTFDLSTLTQGVYTFVVQSPNQLASAIFIKN